MLPVLYSVTFTSCSFLRPVRYGYRLHNKKCPYLCQPADNVADGLLGVEHDVQLEGGVVQVLEDNLDLPDAGQQELVKVHTIGRLLVLLKKLKQI